MERKKVELKIKAQGGEAGEKCVRALVSVITETSKIQENKKMIAAMCLGYLRACAYAGFINKEDEKELVSLIAAMGAGLVEIEGSSLCTSKNE